jgi:hypothetical protein
MCFFSNSHSGIFLSRVFSSSAFIKSAITGQRVTPENRFAMPKRAPFFVVQAGLSARGRACRLPNENSQR